MTRFKGSILAALVILVLVGGTMYYVMTYKDSLTYENTLPEEPTPQLLDFFRHKLFNGKSFISTEHPDGYMYEEGIINDNQAFIRYAFSSSENIQEYYYDRLNSEEEDKYAYKNVNPNSYLENVHDPTKYNLPNISVSDNVLRIQTVEDELFFSKIPLADDVEFEVAKTNHINVVGANEDAFYLNITESKNDEFNTYVLFMKQDLTDYQIIEGTDEAFEEFMQTEQFTEYNSLFPAIDENERYLNYYTNDQVIDVKNNELITIKREDYLSDDGKYVYLSGSDGGDPSKPLSKGKQSIQRLEDYVAGNDVHHLTFDLNYKTIKKSSDIDGIGTSVSDSNRKTVYFNEELLVIHLTYDAIFFGIAGYTNVVVDFHEDRENPNFYILNLSAR